MDKLLPGTLWLMMPALLALAQISLAADAQYASERAHMARVIEATAEATSLETARARFDPRVMAAMGTVPRHEFVPATQRPYAYENRPLPIGHGQTISQPYIVALMTELAEVDSLDAVLEIGTGSGYQAAILGQLAAKVYTVEIIKPLAEQAAARLRRLGYDNVKTRIGDGYYGWEAFAPFDAILVTAAASHIPPPLIRQLKPGGRMIIPVGGRFFTQELMLVTKDQSGAVKARQILPVRFVPLTGEH